MKKLYRKSTVHPSPASPSSPPPPPLSDHLSLSYLPAAILALAAALSAADREVLSYLLSCPATTSRFDSHPSTKSHHRNRHHLHHGHPPSFSCYCFSCYTSYWARWDSSPNRQLIHEIIDAFEDGLLPHNRRKKQGMSRKEKRKNSGNNKDVGLDLNGNGDNSRSDGSSRVNPELERPESVEEAGGCEETGDDETGGKQGSVRKIVSFIGERIWGSVWG